MTSRVLGVLAALCMFAIAALYGAPPSEPPVKALRITVLSTMLASPKGMGEWGFAALVEADGRRLLFDAGNRPDVVLNNAAELGIDLSGITDVVISHHHPDHVGGLLTLRRAFRETFPAAFSRIHVASGAFISRGPGRHDGDENPLVALRPRLEKEGATFIEHAEPVELLPGVWFTGPIKRVHPDEQPIPAGWVMRSPEGKLVPDSTPDDAALVFDTSKGLVVLTGCGHAGLVNTLLHARETVRAAPVHAVAGGFHLFRSPDGALDWTARQLRELGVRHIHGGHCTGLEAVYRLRRELGLVREAASVAAVGSWFDLETGIDPLDLAR